MKKLLSLFVIVLSICVYPVFLRVPAEISHVYGLVEVDLFSWYRMWLVVIVGSLFLLTVFEKIPKAVYLYWGLLTASVLLSQYRRTSIFGSLWSHEGYAAIVGYIGIFLAAKRYGLTKGLEKAINISVVLVFIFSIIQLTYGNFLGWIAPKLTYQVIKWPLSSTQGCANHLGLFSALLYPYAYYKKKYALCAMLLFMLVCSESRGAWLAVAVATLFMGRKAVFYTVAVCLFLSLPFYKDTADRVQRIFKELHYPVRDSDLSGRAYMWKKALPMMKHTLLIGRGPGTFGIYFPQHKERGKAIGFEGLVVDRPHNMYINIWTTTGLLSLIILIYAIGKIIWNGTNPGLVMGATAFLIAGLTTDSVLSVTPYFMIFLGALTHKGET